MSRSGPDTYLPSLCSWLRSSRCCFHSMRAMWSGTLPGGRWLKVEGWGRRNKSWWRNGFAKLQNIFFLFFVGKQNRGCWEVWIYLILFPGGLKKLMSIRICGSCFEDFGASSCQRCSTGFYQDTLGQNRCKACPTDRTTLGLGAESIAECVCTAGFIEAWSMNVGGCSWSPQITDYRYFSRRVLVYLWSAGGWNRVRPALFPWPQPSALITIGRRSQSVIRMTCWRSIFWQIACFCCVLMLVRSAR